MAKLQANSRLSKEYATLAKSPPPFVIARPFESNLLECHFILRGPDDSPYTGGEYHGVLLFPPQYPFAPPGIKMFTPSGRFLPDRRLCTSFSDFHAGSWNPAWSVATILTGLLSFMVSDELTTGSMRSSEDDKRRYAQESHACNLRNTKFRTIFPDYCTPEAKRLPNMGESDKGKPDGPPLPKNLGNPDGSQSADGLADKLSNTSLKGSTAADQQQAARVQSRSTLLYAIIAVVVAALVMGLLG